MSENLFELRALVKGTVQGVGFRATVKLIAERLHLLGNVRNLLDGDVKIVAQGTKQELEHFLDLLRSGSMKRYIQSIECQYGPAQTTYECFSVER